MLEGALPGGANLAFHAVIAVLAALGMTLKRETPAAHPVPARLPRPSPLMWALLFARL